MMNYLFSASGRLNRARFWLAALIYLAAAAVVSLVCVALWQVIPGGTNDDGTGFKVEGVRAIPYLVLIFGYFVFCVWSGICVAIKRYHDRDKSGAWILIQFVPVIGAIWYFVEAGCLRGTVGPNRYGPDPLGGASVSPAAYGQPAEFRRA
jgi:uncharacterized membrane protein YhaH (DUF805 family)